MTTESNGSPIGNGFTDRVRILALSSPGATARNRTEIGALPTRCSTIELRRHKWRRAWGMIPIPLSGTHRLAGGPGNRAGCALLAEGGGIEPLTLRSPWFSGPVASHLAAPSLVSERGVEPPCARRQALDLLCLPFHHSEDRGDSNSQSHRF